MVQWSVNGLGVNSVAAVSAAFKLSMFFCCVFDALASTMATFAGQNIGARKVDRVRQGMRAASAVGLIYCGLAFGIVLLFGDELLGLFIDSSENAEVMGLAFRFLKINAAFYIPLLYVNILRLCIQGMGYTRVAMFAGLAEMLARTVVALFLVPAAGFVGACFANPAAWVMADLFLFPCYFKLVKSLHGRLLPGVEADKQEKGKVIALKSA
jgi:Na+-driven multidrug efflux pump